MVLCSKDAGIQKHQNHDQPEHPLGFADFTGFSPHGSVPSENISSYFPIFHIDGEHTFQNFSSVFARRFVGCVFAVSFLLQ